MSKLSFEPVDHIQAATGANHYYRAFQIDDESWIVYVHQFDQLQAARGFLPDPFVYTTPTFEKAQVFAQAFEDSKADLPAARIAKAMRTFDDTYGKHALVLRPGEDGPAFGRVDVTQLGMVGDPVFMPEGYVPEHAK